MSRKEGSAAIPDGETVDVLTINCGGMSDVDILALKINHVPGVTIYLLQDGRLYDTVQDAIGDDDTMEPQQPAIDCDTMFTVRVLNESGFLFDSRAAAQYVIRHSNRAPAPSRIKVKPNLRLRRRFINDSI